MQHLDPEYHNNTRTFGFGGKEKEEPLEWKPCTAENPCLHALSGELCIRCQILKRERSGANFTDQSGWN
jgi:hypothetical protein